MITIDTSETDGRTDGRTTLWCYMGAVDRQTRIAR